MNFWLVFCYFSVPSRGPPSFSGYNLSSSVIDLSWSPIPNQYRQGILQGYAILWRNTSTALADWNRTTVDANTINTTIGNLSSYINYTFRIAGFTSQGDGNFSADIVVITGEDGKLNRS